MNITILGTGHMARTLGTGLIGAGHDIVFGSRSPHPPQSRDELPGPVQSHAEAITQGDVVISALAAAHSLELLTSLRAPLAGRILIDIGNAVNEQMDLIYPDGSLGQRLQAALPETKVVKTLNTVGGQIGIDPALLPAASNVFLSGEDVSAKRVVSGVLGSLGWPVEQQIDLGGIDTARAVEHYFLLFATLMGALQTPAFNIAVVR